MVFSSLAFLFYFLPAVLCLYYIIPKDKVKTCNFVLLACSLFFYFYGEPKLIVVMLFSILCNYVFGRLMHTKQKKVYLAICIVINLSILGLFKYFNFFISSVNRLFGFSVGYLNLIMPIGISFFTFQALSYVIDVYREGVAPQKSIVDLALYITMFPQLIAGPIVRYKDINRQLACRKHTWALFSSGIDRFIGGLAKKTLLANVFAQIADDVFARPAGGLSFSLAWFGALAYTLQIYYDFSGYSDMAIGLCRMFGFELTENFNFPYISKSITDFWRRWHISLSTWFRDYVYIPLGGNRCSKRRHIFNMLVVWMLTGFWHGANYTFIVWGLYFGVLLALEKQFLTDVLNRIPAVFSRVYALFFIVLGWVFFRSDSLTYAAAFIRTMFTPQTGLDDKVIEYAARFWPVLICGLFFAAPFYKRFTESKAYKICSIPVLAALLLLSVTSLLTGSYNPFIYFRF